MAGLLALEIETLGERRSSAAGSGGHRGAVRTGRAAASVFLLGEPQVIVRPESPRHHTPMTIKVGILQTGGPPSPLPDRSGSYSATVQELLGPQHESSTFEVRSGELPADAKSGAAYVITGSAS